MHRRRLVRLVVTLLLLMPAGADASSRPTYGGVVTLAWSGAGTLPDPALAREPSQLAIAAAVHGGLFRHDAQGQVRPYLLEGPPQPRAGGRRLRCRLRRPLRFHSGRSVTARDVRWSIERLGRLPAGCPLAWLPKVLRVRIIDRRTFDLELAPGLTPQMAQTLLAGPRAAILRRGAGPLDGVGPFRPAAGSSAPVLLEAWTGCPWGRPYLDAVRLEATQAGSGEAEAFYYGRLDVTFSDDRRLGEYPTVAGPERQTLVAVAHTPWRGQRWSEARDALAAIVAAGRGELSRHFDLPARPARHLRPDGRSPVGDPAAAPGDWGGEPLTLAYADEAALIGEAAGALRDLLKSHGMAQTTATRSEELPPRCPRRRCREHDFRVEVVSWPAPDAAAPLPWLKGWLGLDLGGRSGLQVQLRDSARAWRRFSRAAEVLPLLHFRRTVRYRRALAGLRFSPAGALVLEDIWRKESP